MAESVSRRAILKSAWAEYWNDDEARPPINHYFECGFDAAWDALLAEIRPLVADLQTHDWSQRHSQAVLKLRERVREG